MPQCVTPKCGSYAINHGSHGRDGSDGDLCDVCYWRKRAGGFSGAACRAPAPAAQWDACDAKHIAALTEIVRMPNAEYVADAHNAAVKYLRARAAKEGDKP